MSGWQDWAAAAVVLASLAYLARSVGRWIVGAVADRSSCGGCHGCAANRSVAGSPSSSAGPGGLPLVTLDPQLARSSGRRVE